MSLDLTKEDSDFKVQTMWGERGKNASAATSYTNEDAQDAVGLMVTDTATIDLTYTDATPELKADVVAGSIGTAQLTDDGVTNAKLAEMPAKTIKANATAVTANPQDVSIGSLAAMLALGIQVSNGATMTGTMGSRYVIGRVNETLYLSTSTRLAKVNMRTGIVTSFTPGAAGNGDVFFEASLGTSGKFICGNSTGYDVFDVSAETFSGQVTPTGWGQVSCVYYGGNVYYSQTSRVARIPLAGGVVSNGNTIGGTSTGNRCILVGSAIYFQEVLATNLVKIVRYTIGSWPAIDAATYTTVGAVGLTSGLGYHSGANLLMVGDTNGIIRLVDPSAMTLTTSISLGTTAAMTWLHYDAATDRIFALDNGGKIWLIDGTTYSVLTYIIPTSSPSANGSMNYCPTAGILAVTVSGTGSLQRMLA